METTTVNTSGVSVEETTIVSAVEMVLPSTEQTETTEIVSVDTTDYAEMLAYQNERLTEISTLLAYQLILAVVVIAVLVSKWISSVINAV